MGKYPNSCIQYEVKLSWINIRLTYGHLRTRNDQQQTYTNTACENQALTINIALRSAHNRRTAEKNTISRVILKHYKEKKKFLKEIEIL